AWRRASRTAGIRSATAADARAKLRRGFRAATRRGTGRRMARDGAALSRAICVTAAMNRQRIGALIASLLFVAATHAHELTMAQPTIHLYGPADDPRGMREIAAAYAVLGVEHLLTGTNHTLFVTGLPFLVGFNRRLVWTITAFTLAHSITLALAALCVLTPSAP